MMRKTSIPSKIFSFLLLGFFLLGLFCINSSNANAATFTVPGDFATIKDAVNDPSVMDGDTINVLAGTYNETNILITKQLTISGAGIGVTIIDPGGAQGLRVDSDNVTLKDLTVQNARIAIRLTSSVPTIDNIALLGLQLINSSRGVVVGHSTTVTNLIVRDSDISNNGQGFRVHISGHLDIARISDSTFDGNNIGIHVINKGNTSTINNVRIQGNTFSNHTVGRGTAIYLEEAQDTRIIGNLFMDNRNDIVISKLYQPAVPVSDVRISRNTMTGTTGVVFTLFNADNGGQTVFNSVRFAINDITTTGTAILASAHRTGAGAGGTGWNTVRVKRNCISGVGAGNAVRFFVPAGVLPDQALGGAILNARNNFWGVGTLPGVTALMENPTITDFTAFQTSCTM